MQRDELDNNNMLEPFSVCWQDATCIFSFFYYDIIWDHRIQRHWTCSLILHGQCLLSQSAKQTSKKQNCCFGEAGGTWSAFALGQLCLGRAPLWLQWFVDSWGVFRHMWRAACDQCHFNFSLVIMWWRMRLNDASLAEGIHWSPL